MRKLVLSIGAILALFLIGGCGSDSSSTGDSSSEATTLEPFRIPIPGGKAPIRYEKELKLNPSALAGPEPKPVIPKASPPDFLALSDLIRGIGELAAPGGK